MRSGSPHCARGRTALNRGMTLIELSFVAIMIVALTMIAIPSVTNITRADLRATASRLSATMRYAFDLATRKSASFRLVLDLDEQSYWLESTTEGFRLDREKEDVVRGVLAEREEKRRFFHKSAFDDGTVWQPKKRAAFSAAALPLTPKIELPSGVGFKDVWVDHQTESVTAGRAFVYFFPTGITQQAVIHLVDDSDNVYTLWSEPLTGRVRIYPELREAPDA